MAKPWFSISIPIFIHVTSISNVVFLHSTIASALSLLVHFFYINWGFNRFLHYYFLAESFGGSAVIVGSLSIVLKWSWAERVARSNEINGHQEYRYQTTKK